MSGTPGPDHHLPDDPGPSRPSPAGPIPAAGGLPRSIPGQDCDPADRLHAPPEARPGTEPPTSALRQAAGALRRAWGGPLARVPRARSAPAQAPAIPESPEEVPPPGSPEASPAGDSSTGGGGAQLSGAGTADVPAVAPQEAAVSGSLESTRSKTPSWDTPGTRGRHRAPGVPALRPRAARGRRPWTVLSVRAAGGGVGAAGLGWTLWHGIQQPGTALAFGILITVGELLRWGPDGREAAPLGAAGALGYALLGGTAGHPATHGVLQTAAVVGAAVLAGNVPHVALDRVPLLDHLAHRVLIAAFAATCFQPLRPSGALGTWTGQGLYYAVCLVFLLVLTALCDAVLRAAFAHAVTGWPYGSLLRDELRSPGLWRGGPLLGITPAICASGAAMALAVSVAGLWALPVFSVPLLLTQFSFRRYGAVRATYRQTIASLARATEIAGYTPAGHARRVAGLSRAVGRELGLSEPELTVLEYAALMHDIGQLSLVDPVPLGATEPLPPEEQRRIALLGGAVVRQTGVPSEVALIVERQAEPYCDQPIAARIVRTVNAYEDLAGSGGHLGGPLGALERLRLGTARDYEPRVVEALVRVLARGGPMP